MTCYLSQDFSTCDLHSYRYFAVRPAHSRRKASHFPLCAKRVDCYPAFVQIKPEPLRRLGVTLFVFCVAKQGGKHCLPQPPELRGNAIIFGRRSQLKSVFELGLGYDRLQTSLEPKHTDISCSANSCVVLVATEVWWGVQEKEVCIKVHC